MTTPTALAPEPQRATSSFTLSWGLVTIPVQAFTGTQATRVARKEFLRDEDEVAVGRAPIRKDTGDVVDKDNVVRKAQASNGEWVVLTDEEIADCTAPKGEGKIVSFVPNESRDDFLAENQMQVRPRSSTRKPDPAAERAFALLSTAMLDRNVSALVQIALRGPARYGLLDYDGTFTLIYTADAIRKSRPLPDVQPTEQELAMAQQLIDTVGIDPSPVLTDTTAPVVQEFVDAKTSGKPLNVPAPTPASTDDLMATLEASIQAHRAERDAS